MLKINVSIDSKGLDKYKNMFDLGGPMQTYLDNLIIKGIEPYVPMDTGATMQSAKSSHKPGEGKITWSTPYARALWHGKTIGGKDMQFNTNQNRLAGPRWTERYKANNMKTLRKQIIGRIDKI